MVSCPWSSPLLPSHPSRYPLAACQPHTVDIRGRDESGHQLPCSLLQVSITIPFDRSKGLSPEAIRTRNEVKSSMKVAAQHFAPPAAAEAATTWLQQDSEHEVASHLEVKMLGQAPFIPPNSVASGLLRMLSMVAEATRVSKEIVSQVISYHVGGRSR